MAISSYSIPKYQNARSNFLRILLKHLEKIPFAKFNLDFGHFPIPWEKPHLEITFQFVLQRKGSPKEKTRLRFAKRFVSKLNSVATSKVANSEGEREIEDMRCRPQTLSQDDGFMSTMQILKLKGGKRLIYYTLLLMRGGEMSFNPLGADLGMPRDW